MWVACMAGTGSVYISYVTLEAVEDALNHSQHASWATKTVVSIKYSTVCREMRLFLEVETVLTCNKGRTGNEDNCSKSCAAVITKLGKHIKADMGTSPQKLHQSDANGGA